MLKTSLAAALDPTATALPEPVAPAPSERPGAISDVLNLFAHFGAAGAAGFYQEIRSDADAGVAAQRWPLMAEMLAGAAPKSGTGR